MKAGMKCTRGEGRLHPRVRRKFNAFILFSVALLGFAAAARGAGTYVKVDYPASTVPGELQTAVTYTVWIPEGVKTLRGIIVHQHGAGTTASKEGSTAAYDLHWQALAKKWDCALLGPSYQVLNEKVDTTPGGSEHWFDPRRGSEKTFLKALDDLAAKSGHGELPAVPWILWGHSGGGIWANVMAALHPDRVVALWLRSGTVNMFRMGHSEFPELTVPDALYAIPCMCNPGVKEKPNNVYKGNLATFKEYRAKGGLIGFALDPRTGHECGDCRYLAIPFLDACMAARLPDKGSKEQTLKPMDTSHAWLAPPLGETAVPAAKYQGNPNEAVWLPNEAVAKAWMEYVKTGAVGDTTPPPAPTDVKVSPLGDRGMLITWSADADFESGIRQFIVLRDGKELAKAPEKPVGRFGRPLFQGMTYHDTPDQPLRQMRYVDGSATAGDKHTYAVITVNGVGLKSEPSAVASKGDDTARAGTGTSLGSKHAPETMYPTYDGLKGDMILWYRQPATRWNEAMPMGNGLIGAMVFGGVQKERIALNESSFWSGRPHDYNDPEAIKYFPRIRDLVFEGKFQEAEQMANTHFWGVPASQQCFEPLGDLLLEFDGPEKTGKVEDYRRELDLETGVAKISYRAGWSPGFSRNLATQPPKGGTPAVDAIITRELFVSYPDRALVERISSDKPGSISVKVQLKSPFPFAVTAKPGKLVMDGHWKGPVKGDWIGPTSGEGLRFETALVARSEGGKSEAIGSSLQITGADAVTLVLAAATSFVNYQDISGDPAARCQAVLAGAAGKDYATLRSRHMADFAGLMDRVHLSVGDNSANEKPTDVRLQTQRARGGRGAGRRGDGQPLAADHGYMVPAADANLEALCFQFGRYALVSSSRPGGQSANLQAIWNEVVSPPWGSKYTININTQMNYWPTEVCNLSECHQPLFDMIKDASIAGATTAKMYYGVNGWVTHHNLDLWRGTAPVDRAQFGMWPVGGAWLCQHLWEHYAYTGDKAFLKECYPVMRGSAQFLLEVMVEEPKHHWLVTPFSMSPEHGYYDSQGRMSFLSPSPTMDVAIIRELFPHCIEAAKVLGIDEEFRGKLEAALTRIPPYQISSSGNLQEWIEDWKPGPQGHNVSPQFTFFPGSSIQLRRDPKLAGAIEHWMSGRGAGGGWVSAWSICMWSRLERGDKVGAGIDSWVARSPGPNMYNAGANQCDATFGFTSGVAESLVQSHAGEISLLPALSTGWRDGSVTGLRARGGYEVGMTWHDGKLQSAEIRSSAGGVCKLRYRDRTAPKSFKPGEIVRVDANLASIDD